MAPARSVAASVVALGFAGTLTAPLPALAAAAPGCDRAKRYAAQSGAELLRIDRLDLKPGGRIADSRTKSSLGTADESPDGPTADPSDSPAEDPSDGPVGGPVGGFTGGQGGGAPQEAVADVGLGHARSVLIAGAPVSSAGAARILNGKVAGTRNDLVVQQAPPTRPKGSTRKTEAKQYGPISVGAGALDTRAVWAAGMACGTVPASATKPGGVPVSTAGAEISRIAVTGAGNGALVRVPETISSRSGTALRRQGAITQSIATASITAGRISLVDNEVRLQVVRSPLLTVTAGGKSRVDYRSAVVQVTSRGKQARLDTPGDYVDITLSDDLRPLESAPARLDPTGGLPLPTVPGLPALTETENSPIPSTTDGSLLRISLGSVRQATDGQAIAAAATAIRVTVVRNDSSDDSKPSGVVADLGIGMLQAAAVAPGGKKGRPGTAVRGTADGNGSGGKGTGDGQGPGGGPDSSGGAIGGHGPGSGGGDVGGNGSTGGFPAGSAFGNGLPLTGPKVASLLAGGAILILGGAAAVFTTTRRRRRHQ